VISEAAAHCTYTERVPSRTDKCSTYFLCKKIGLDPDSCSRPCVVSPKTKRSSSSCGRTTKENISREIVDQTEREGDVVCESEFPSKFAVKGTALLVASFVICFCDLC
jgi:hypothetical protein